jgi:hypothetical protein
MDGGHGPGIEDAAITTITAVNCDIFYPVPPVVESRPLFIGIHQPASSCAGPSNAAPRLPVDPVFAGFVPCSHRAIVTCHVVVCAAHVNVCQASARGFDRPLAPGGAAGCRGPSTPAPQHPSTAWVGQSVLRCKSRYALHTCTNTTWRSAGRVMSGLVDR